VLRLQKKQGELHVSDVGALRRAHATLSQNVQALYIEAQVTRPACAKMRAAAAIRCPSAALCVMGSNGERLRDLLPGHARSASLPTAVPAPGQGIAESISGLDTEVARPDEIGEELGALGMVVAAAFAINRVLRFAALPVPPGPL